MSVGAEPPPRSASLVGRLFGPYRIVDRLGEGGMGEVFLAEDSRLRRPVALKMLGARSQQDPAGCERLAREARVASLLNHPGIAVVYETGTLEMDGDPRAYIAMEYVAGESLKARLARETIEPLEAADLALQIADALEEAHARGVVHRDIKPANVVLDGRCRAKLLDFGLASYTPVADGSETWSGPEGILPPGALAGTISYMAPEQARGRGVDSRADVFALGALLYEMLAGRPPFTGESAVDVLDALLREPPPPIEHRGPGAALGRALEDVARRMLAKDPEGRYAGMGQVKRALREASGAAAPRAPAPAAVAVVAFANRARNPDDDWLGTGIAETVASELKQLAGVTVLPRDRILEARTRLGLVDDAEAESAAQRLGRELGARWVVVGSYQRVGESIRLAARVLDAESGSVAQSTSVDGTMAGIFAAQDQVVAAVVRAVRGELGTSAAQEGEETRVLEAYEAFSHGVLNLRAQTRDSLDRAIAFFERAIDLDPLYADAHVKLCSALDLKASFGGAAELNPRAIAAVRRALELRPDHSEAWRELASCQLGAGAEAEALASARRAVELDPRSGAAHAALARVRFIGFGDFETAADGFARAIELSPEGGWWALQLAHCAALVGQLERSEAAARQALVLQEGFLSGRQGLALIGAYVRLGHVAALRGRCDDAVELYRQEEAFVRRVNHALAERALIEIRYRTGSALAAGGRSDEARGELEGAVALHEERLRLGRDDPFTRLYVACARALLGDLAGAADDLERAVARRPAYALRRARLEADLRAVIAHPRFAKSLAREP